MTDEPLLDIKQAALYLNVSETSLRRWTNDGRLACLRVGGRHERRFRRADLVAFLERQPARPLVAAGAGVSRSAGAPVVDTPTGTHVCGLYGTDVDRVEIVAAFLAANRFGRAQCYVLARDDVRVAMVARLEETRTVGDRTEGWTILAGAIASSVEAQYAYFETELADAHYDGVDSLVVVCDMWELASTLGMPGLMAYEAGYAERIGRRFPVATLCLYDVRCFSGSELLDGLRRHRDLFRTPDSGALA